VYVLGAGVNQSIKTTGKHAFSPPLTLIGHIMEPSITNDTTIQDHCIFHVSNMYEVILNTIYDNHMISRIAEINILIDKISEYHFCKLFQRTKGYEY
jgi:hypothetical protein